jgi:hypothetical protein
MSYLDSFINGVASVIDLGGTIRRDGFIRDDAVAIAADWAAVGIDISRAIEDSKPVCGKDFCEQCGDCLACYWEDQCQHSPDGQHSWVKE